MGLHASQVQHAFHKAHALLHRQRFDRDVGHVEQFEQQLDHAVDAHDVFPFQARPHAVSDNELAKRRAAWVAPPLKATRGTLYKYIKNVKSASEGCVTDE